MTDAPKLSAAIRSTFYLYGVEDKSYTSLQVATVAAGGLVRCQNIAGRESESGWRRGRRPVGGEHAATDTLKAADHTCTRYLIVSEYFPPDAPAGGSYCPRERGPAVGLLQRCNVHRLQWTRGHQRRLPARRSHLPERRAGSRRKSD